MLKCDFCSKELVQGKDKWVESADGNSIICKDCIMLGSNEIIKELKKEQNDKI